MPQFYNSSGHPCANGDFEFRDGRLARRTGPVADGEYIGFDMAFVDTKTARSIFLTDSKAPAENRAVRDAALSLRYSGVGSDNMISHLDGGTRHASGGAQPQFNDSGSAMRAAALAFRYGN